MDVGLHLGIPTAGSVAEMHTSFDQFLCEDVGCGHTLIGVWGNIAGNRGQGSAKLSGFSLLCQRTLGIPAPGDKPRPRPLEAGNGHGLNRAVYPH